MDRFLSRYRPLISAVLSGFDRLVFRGTLLPLIMPGGMFCFLQRAHVGLLDFKAYVEATTERVKAAALREAVEHDRPIRYLASSDTDKEKLARHLLAEHPVSEGLICAFKTVEPCMSFEYHRSPDRRERGLRLRRRTCLHIYQYYRHPAPDLGPLQHPDLAQRPRVARPATSPPRLHRVPASRQGLHLGRRPRPRPAPPGPATHGRLAANPQHPGPRPESPPQRDLQARAENLLLDRLPDRVGH
jgi:hypothetical protein